MGSEQRIFIGTDSGATTSKIAAVWENGEAVSTKLLQRPTNAQNGRDAVIAGWIAGIGEFLAQNRLQWPQVRGVGLAIPGPYLRYGVLGKSPNLPADFSGWDVHNDFSAALTRQAGRPVKLTMNNDGHCGGVAEARIACAGRKQSVLDADARLRSGQRVCGRQRLAAHRADADRHGNRPYGRTAAPVRSGRPAVPVRLREKLGLRRSLYTTISGLPHLLAEKLKKFPGHELAQSTAPMKEKVLSLRSRAQKGDALALEIFDFQARAMGFHVANLVMVLDPGIVIIGGGLMDHEATTPEFRERYLHILRETAHALSLAGRNATPSKSFQRCWANCRRPSAPRWWRFIKAGGDAQPARRGFRPLPAPAGGGGSLTID